MMWHAALVSPARRGDKRSRSTRRVRWIGRATLALIVVSVAGALVVAQVTHLGIAQTAVSLFVTAAGSLSLIYLAWKAFQREQAQDRDVDLAGLADRLAGEIRDQWQEEARARSLNDPYPLPVRWVAAEPSLSDRWDVLVTLARSGAGSLGHSDAWASSPGELRGGGNELARVLAQVPTGRLVVLGEPGTGKTMLMVRLVLDLLARREPGGRVPALVSMASWNPAEADLREWLAARLALEHPAVADDPPGGSLNGIAMLLREGLILPLLDGLDEIPGQMQGLAIARIGNWLGPGDPMVLTCRTERYQSAVRPPGRDPVRLGAAAIKLLPLDSDAVADYLRTVAGGSAPKNRWAAVIDALATQAPVARVLTTPLMVGLARAIYSPGPADDPRDPSELCDPALTDPVMVERLLFDGFILAAYRPERAAARGCPANAPERWLVFLAHYLEHAVHGPDFAWWQLQQAVSPALAGVVCGLGAGLLSGLGAGIGAGIGTGPAVGLAVGLAAVLAAGPAIGLAAIRWGLSRPADPLRQRFPVNSVTIGLAAGLGTALAVGLAFGLSSGLAHGPVAGAAAGYAPALTAGLASGLGIGLAAVKWKPTQPSRGLRWRFSLASLASGLAAGIAAGLGTGLTYGLRSGPQAGLIYGPLTALAIGISIGLAAGLEGVPPDLAATSPDAVLRLDRRAALLAGLVIGIGVGCALGLGFPPGIGIVVGLAAGLAFGPAVSMLKTAWPSYCLICGWLALRRRLPWPLMTFLADAHRRGVLRQAGAFYQFRHIELQRHLATKPGCCAACARIAKPHSNRPPPGNAYPADQADQPDSGASG